MCKPIAPPNTLIKNNSKTPIPNFTVVCPITRMNFTGVPTSSNRMISPTIIDMTTVELKFITSFFLNVHKFSAPSLLCMYIQKKKEPVRWKLDEKNEGLSPTIYGKKSSFYFYYKPKKSYAFIYSASQINKKTVAIRGYL